MRSSKSRSRSKSNNRPRSPVGNIINRVFESSGPEGKVRGTPQQIIEKYNQLARDAQLSNDRVAAENFQQHAEHYDRMLGEALREQEARREQHESQNNRNNDNRDSGGRGGNDQPRQNDQANAPQPETAQPETRPADVIDTGSQDGDSGLVETPEERPAPRKRPQRKPKPAPAAKSETSADDAPVTPLTETPAAE